MGYQNYEIHIKGHLNHNWADWFESMQMRCLESGEMILCGALADQAALMGVLNKLNRLNLTILSVNKTDRKEPQGAAHNQSAAELDK